MTVETIVENPNNLNIEYCQSIFEFLRDFKKRTQDFKGYYGTEEKLTFYMGDYFATKNYERRELLRGSCPRDAYTHCGTSCCVAGWAPYVWNEPMKEGDDFGNYFQDKTGLAFFTRTEEGDSSHPFNFICGGEWENIPETAAFRLQYLMRFLYPSTYITQKVLNNNYDGRNGYTLLPHYEEMDKYYLPKEWLEREPGRIGD
jgi:hypothetical protein